jgi:diaminopimelate epimerase
MEGTDFLKHQYRCSHAVLFEDAEGGCRSIGKGQFDSILFCSGTNANFVREKDSQLVRTYERGVEDETLAVAQGCCSALVALLRLVNLGVD